MTRLSEKRDVQDQLVNHLMGIGWRYLHHLMTRQIRLKGKVR